MDERKNKSLNLGHLINSDSAHKVPAPHLSFETFRPEGQSPTIFERNPSLNRDDHLIRFHLPHLRKPTPPRRFAWHLLSLVVRFAKKRLLGKS